MKLFAARALWWGALVALYAFEPLAGIVGLFIGIGMLASRRVRTAAA